jgi:hypothetical protein
MTWQERAQIREAMRLFATDDGYDRAMRLLRVLAGGPKETTREKQIREAGSVKVTDLFNNKFKCGMK